MIACSAVRRLLREEVWQRRTLAAMTAILVVVYVAGVVSTAAIHRSLAKGDARSYFAFLPSLVLDHDIDLRNQFSVLKPEGDSEYPFGVGRGGRARAPFPVSPALLWL